MGEMSKAEMMKLMSQNHEELNHSAFFDYVHSLAMSIRRLEERVEELENPEPVKRDFYGNPK